MADEKKITRREGRDVKAAIAFENDPHRAALEDNPAEVKVSVQSWVAIFSLALAFGPALGLPFRCIAAIVVQVTRDLGGEEDLAWVVGAWSLAAVCSFSLGGPLSDVFGRRIMILFGEAVILVGNIVGATAQNVASLIACETLIGLGTGFLFVSYAGVPEMLPNKWRSLGLGILEGGATIPWGILSVLIANVLYERSTWRWLFYIGIISEAIGLGGTAAFYWPTPRPRGDFEKSRWRQFQDIDWLGLSLFTSGLATCLIGLTWGGTPERPWKSADALVPILLGLSVLALAFVYDFGWAKAPMFPFKLFAMIRGYLLIIVVLFVSGMNFHALAALLPQGFLYMFTTDGIEIGILSLPNTLLVSITGVLVPIISHRIGHVKWQLVVGMALQGIFLAASAATVYPNQKIAWSFVPACGVSMFILVTILGYSIASLHVPHSELGLAMGLLGTFRATGGAVGNAIFNSVFQDKFHSYAATEISHAADHAGLNASSLERLVAATVQYNLGESDALAGFKGMTPDIQDILQTALRSAYGHAFKFVFYITIPFSVVALVSTLLVEDPTAYLTNHVQSAMKRKETEERIVE